MHNYNGAVSTGLIPPPPPISNFCNLLGSFSVQKLMLRLRFLLKSMSKLEVKTTESKILVQIERSCHKEYTCVIWTPHLSRVTWMAMILHIIVNDLGMHVKSPSLGRRLPLFDPISLLSIHLPPRNGNLPLFEPHFLPIIYSLKLWIVLNFAMKMHC